MLKDKRNCFTKVSQAILACFNLAICSRHFSAICDEPRAILFDDCGEHVTHDF